MKYRGLRNLGASMKKVILRRSIDLRELGVLGSITDNAGDLPTSGAVHRGSLASTSGTRNYTDLSTITDYVVVDTQDMGLVTEDNGSVTHDFAYYEYVAPTDALTAQILSGNANAGGSGSTGSAPTVALTDSDYVELVLPTTSFYDSSSAFGYTFEINDDFAVVGAPSTGPTYATRESGAAYVYNLSDGSLTSSLVSGTTLGQRFADSVAITPDGTKILVSKASQNRVFVYDVDTSGVATYASNTDYADAGTQSISASNEAFVATWKASNAYALSYKPFDPTYAATTNISHSSQLTDLNNNSLRTVKIRGNYIRYYRQNRLFVAKIAPSLPASSIVDIHYQGPIGTVYSDITSSKLISINVATGSGSILDLDSSTELMTFDKSSYGANKVAISDTYYAIAGDRYVEVYRNSDDSLAYTLENPFGDETVENSTILSIQITDNKLAVRRIGNTASTQYRYKIYVYNLS